MTDSTTSTGLFGKPVTQNSSKGIVFGASPITSPQSSSSEATSAPESSISANAPIFGSSATSGAFNFTALAGSATGECDAHYRGRYRNSAREEPGLALIALIALGVGVLAGSVEL